MLPALTCRPLTLVSLEAVSSSRLISHTTDASCLHEACASGKHMQSSVARRSRSACAI
jgi:hypothetical protein